MTEVSIQIEDAAGIKVVHVTGQLDESNVDEKIKEVYKIIEQTPKGLKLLFDFESLEYMNSKSIGYLTDIYGKITESGGQVVIAKAKPNITDILQVVGLTQLVRSFNSVDEAKNYLAGTLPATPTAEQPAAPPATPPTEPPAAPPATPPTEPPAIPTAPPPANPA